MTEGKCNTCKHLGDSGCFYKGVCGQDYDKWGPHCPTCADLKKRVEKLEGEIWQVWHRGVIYGLSFVIRLTKGGNEDE